MNTIEETYRIVDPQDKTRERGLLVITTTMVAGRPLTSQTISFHGLGDEPLHSGEYALDFVKKIHDADLYRKVRQLGVARSFNQLTAINDRVPQ